MGAYDESHIDNGRRDIVQTYPHVYARQHICYSAYSVYAIARPSVCPSITRVDYTKTVEVKIMKFSPYGSPIPLVFAW